MRIRFLGRKRSSTKAAKERMSLPDGRVINKGDVIDTDEHGISEATLQHFFAKKYIEETDDPATYGKQLTATESAAAELEAHDEPSDKWTVPELREYLTANDIAFTSRTSKPDLLLLAQGGDPDPFGGDDDDDTQD